jgi:DNA replication protein DnaC
LYGRLRSGLNREGKVEERLPLFVTPKLLIIDELGYLPFEPNAAHLCYSSS